MPDSTYTALLLVVDRSGSMASIRDDMVGGLKTLLADQKEVPGLLTVDYVQFDNEIDWVCEFADPENVTVTLDPRGGTALHDALGFAINSFAQRIDALPDHAAPGMIQVIVVTDGHENASAEYSAKQIKKIITDKQKDERWDFVFLGANQDAITTGAELGFQADASMNFAASAPAVAQMNYSTSRYMRDRRSGRRQGFSSAERDRSNRRGH